MQAGRKHWNVRAPSPFRQPNMTFWPRNDPVVLPRVKTDHWAKMRSEVIHTFPFSVPIAVLLEKGISVSPQNLPQYRNEYNDRARRGFCYWPIEQKASKYIWHEQNLAEDNNSQSTRTGLSEPPSPPLMNGYRHSFGAYKTALGLPRI